MTEHERIDIVKAMLESANRLTTGSEPALTLNMSRIAAILHDTLRLIDLDYAGSTPAPGH